METRLSGKSTLKRIFDILNAFDEEHQKLTLTDIHRNVALPKSTTHRFLTALEGYGLLRQTSEKDGYVLGYKLIQWGMQAQNAIEMREIAMPVLQQLSEATGETSVLSIRDGDSAVWVEQVETNQAVRWTKRVGMRIMLHAGSSSKVLWAFLPQNEAEEILQNIELKPLMPNTITDRQKMREELHQIRSQGYATSFEETDQGAMGVASPVFDHTGKSIAGIGIIAPISRVPPEKLPAFVRQVVRAGKHLSEKLGAYVN